MMLKFEFHPKKALAAVGLLALHSGESTNIILNLVYLSDCLHLDCWGRTITGDMFFAHPKGASPVRIYSSLKAIYGGTCRNHLPGSDALLGINSASHRIETKASPDLADLSQSEVECMETIISILGDKGRVEIRARAQDTAWRATAENANIPFESIIGTFKKGETLLNHLNGHYLTD